MEQGGEGDQEEWIVRAKITQPFGGSACGAVWLDKTVQRRVSGDEDGAEGPAAPSECMLLRNLDFTGFLNRNDRIKLYFGDITQIPLGRRLIRTV